MFGSKPDSVSPPLLQCEDTSVGMAFLEQDDVPQAELDVWYEHVQQHTAFAFAILVQIRDLGILLLCSTAASTNRLAYIQETGSLDGPPHWYEFDVHEYPDLMVFNYRDLATAARIYRGSLTSFCADRGMDLGGVGPMRVGASVYEGLRTLVKRYLGGMWLELTIGLSYRGYRMLDFYITQRSIPAQVPPVAVAWYLLNATSPWQERTVPSPFSWWEYCGAMIPYGQRGVPNINIHEALYIEEPRIGDRAADKQGDRKAEKSRL